MAAVSSIFLDRYVHHVHQQKVMKRSAKDRQKVTCETVLGKAEFVT